MGNILQDTTENESMMNYVETALLEKATYLSITNTISVYNYPVRIITINFTILFKCSWKKIWN